MDDRELGLDAVCAELRRLPDVDSAAKARVLIAVAAERARDRESAERRRAWSLRLRWMSGGAALVAAALLGVVFLRPTATATAPPVASAPVSPSAATQLASSDAGALEMAAQPVQFVFSAPSAANVRVVGDFNGWDNSKSPMVRDASSGLWSTTLLIRPGRYVYAFVVDDSVWRRDPRAVAAKDADFGRPGSVLLVGRPPVEGVR